MARKKWWLRNIRPKKYAKLKAEHEMRKTKADEKLLALKMTVKQKEAEDRFNEIIDDWPTYKKDQELIDQLKTDLNVSQDRLDQIAEDVKTSGAKAIDVLKDTVEGSQAQLDKLYTEQKSIGGGALSKYEAAIGESREGLKRSEEKLQEAQDKSLGVYRDLAKKTRLPGQAAIEDRIKGTTSSALSNIKRLTKGRGGTRALSDVYLGQQQQMTDLGIAGAQNKQAMELNMADKEAGFGTTMADLIRGNAVTEANLGAGIYGAYGDYLNRLLQSGTSASINKANLGQQLYSAESDYMGKTAQAETNAATNLGSQARSIYDVERGENILEYQSEQAPAQLEAGFQANKYTANDPTSYQQSLLGRDYSMAYSDKMTAEAAMQANNRAMIKALIEGVKAVGDRRGIVA